MEKEVRVYTKTGDDGTTGLIGGARVKKYNIRLESYGTVDELNSHVGLIVAMDIDEKAKEVLKHIQCVLFTIGAQLATDDSVSEFKKQIPCKTEDIEMLEKEMDQMFEVLPKLNSFILPGGSIAAAHTQIARTVCRRAERRIIELSEQNEVNKNLVKFINRLSDYLFVLGRKISFDENVPETQWKSGV
ncbi:cob(I)yrinic acid a,c-diamide adenosyltransferase [Sunxiuqinia indica]|uniref:cob(I)yrinic acid a,c-diamide adenosyltransferase n=1 Tax=Sunxiuqinia indica TaxID=2692584 RepID=UPI0013567EED|nr:cob(I)yrinic acid a,c-diamide adenosyltransferase [Sunxiuqinia indica]